MTDYRELCRQVCDLARETGEWIAARRENFTFADVEFKGDQNMVSYVDKTAEKMIVERLRELTPDAGYITEEGTASARREQRIWIIDPLDGTTNFIHGLPPYCVSIALMEGDELVLGVVYEITLRELFHSWKGGKSYLNGKEITVSAVDKLENALIAVGFSYATINEVDDFLDSIAYFARKTNGFRRIGSATADLVYVACGRFDAFSQVKLSPWDVAAGALIARNAGAVVCDYSGGDNYIFGQEIIASNPYIYPQFKEHVR